MSPETKDELFYTIVAGIIVIEWSLFLLFL